MSFRFYDPIFHIIDKLISRERKQIFNIKTQYCLKALKEKDKKQQLYNILGIYGDDNKLSFKTT